MGSYLVPVDREERRLQTEFVRGHLRNTKPGRLDRLTSTLHEIARAFQVLPFIRQGDVYAYFNNDSGGHAPIDARTLRRPAEAPDA